MRNYHTLLEGIVSNPAQPIENLPVLTAEERNQLIVQWNQNAEELPSLRGPAISGSLLPYTLELLSIEHDEVFSRYKPHPYSGRVLLFRSAKQMPGLIADASLGWGQLFGNNLEICVIPGHQQNMLIEPNVRALSAELQKHLQQAQNPTLVSLGSPLQPSF